MDIWFPIAEVSLNIWFIISLGIVVGIASGLFGVGGGFLMTPILIFVGVPPAVAVGTQASQLVAASFSGYLAQAKRNMVDNRMGFVLLVGGLAGSYGGVVLFKYLKDLGQIDAVIAFSYVFFLGLIAILMLVETIKSLTKKQSGIEQASRPSKLRRFARALPLRMYFPASDLHISVILPILVGGLVGILVSLMGIGGGFLMIPAMVYLIGMPASFVSGTSLMQITFVSAMTTILQVVQNNTVDFMLALPLIFGSAFGAQIGYRLSTKLRGEHIRLLLALLVLAIAIKMLFGLMITPDNLFSVEVL